MTVDPTKPAKPSYQPKNLVDPVSVDGETVLSDPPADAASAAALPDAGVRDLRAVSDFAVMKKLGQGGMGVVYAAREKSLARNVAVKRLNELLAADEKHRLGFKAEAVITGKLAHPNIIPIYSMVDERDNLAIAMKLIEGRTLQEILHPSDAGQQAFSAQYDLKAKIQILLAVCNAVRFAHSKEIIHRDIKPGNIMVGEFGEILLLDWGLAVSIAASPETAALEGLPHKSKILGLEGTLFYMPPEMLKSDVKKIGVQTDVYLLGAVLFEILAGTPPHARRKISADLAEPPPPPPTLSADTDHELRNICAEALHPDIAARTASVLDFQTALTDFLRHGESRAACAAGRALLSQANAETQGDRKGDTRTTAYDLFAGAVFSFAAAKDLWHDNEQAVSGERTARLGYAECAAEHGDFGLALLQLSTLKDEPVETLRREIAQKEKSAERIASAGKAAKKIAASAALLTAVSALMFFVVFLGASAMGREAALKTSIHLEKEGREQMARVVADATAQIAARKQLSETALLYFMNIVNSEDLLENFDIPNRTAPVDPARNRQLDKLREKAAPLALSFALVSAKPQLVYSYPENKLQLVDDLHTPHSWFEQVKKFSRMIHTPPKMDAVSGRMLSATAAPILNEDGTLLGAAAMISDLRDILGGMTYPSNWGDEVKTEIVVAGAEEDEKGIVIYFSMDDTKSSKAFDPAPGLTTIRPEDPNIPLKMKQDADAGRIGVVEFTRNGNEVFAGYTSLPGTRAQVMVSVSKRALTAMADEIEATILNESRSRLILLAEISIGVYALLLLASAALLRRVR